MVQNKRSCLILDVTYIRRVLSWNRILGCSYFVRVLNKTWTSSYKWVRVLSKTWNISAHACHMRDDNNKSSFRWQVTQANKMASQSASKTPTKQRNSWTLVEEKEFLILWTISNMSLSHQSVDRFLPTRLGFLLYSLKATSSFWILFHSTVFTRKEDLSKQKKHLLRILFLLKMTARFCFLLQRAILDLYQSYCF